MKRDKDLLKKRDDAIAADFEKLQDQGFRVMVICHKLSDKYFLAPSTIRQIYYDTNYYHRTH